MTDNVVNIDTVWSATDYALKYVRLGWQVLPLDPGSKKPLGRLVPKGFHDATNDPETIKRWWNQHPDAGIGIALRASGLVAVDIDPRNGGIDTIDQLEAEHGPIVSDVLALTGGGGEHRVFSASLVEGLPGTLGPGVDLKADGYIAVEPTLHPSGKRYGWEASSSPLDGIVPSTLPSWIRDKSRAKLTAPVSTVVRPAIPAERLAELTSAMSAIKKPDRDTWWRVGMAINNAMPNQEGFSLWDDWSQTNGGTYDPQDQMRVWKSFRPIGLSGIGIESVFKMAIDGGWKAQKVKQPLAANLEHVSADDECILKEFEGSFDVLEPVEWVLEGFIAARQLVMFAGQPGVGKSTVFSSIALLVAGFGRQMGSDVPNDRFRRVAIISEHPEQYQRLFFGFIKKFGLVPAEVMHMVRVFHSARMTAEELPKEVFKVIKKIGGDEPPFVVVDTASSVFDVSDENNNAEISSMLIALREPVRLTGAPVWVITHAAKALGREDSEITPRGASSYVGDVHATGSVFRDKNMPDSTFIRSLKNRNEREYNEIDIRTEVQWHHVTDERGVIQRVGIRLGVPMMSGDQKRKDAAARASEASREADQAKGMDIMRERVAMALEAAIASGQLLSATDLAEKFAGKKSAKLDCINQMVAMGDLVVTDWPKELRPRAQKQHFYRFPQTDVKALLEAFSAQKNST